MLVEMLSHEQVYEADDTFIRETWASGNN